MNRSLKMVAICLIGITMFFMPTIVQAADVNLQWKAPITNEDGSPLTDLAGYTVYWGNESGIYLEKADVPGAENTSYSVTNLEDGTWYFAVTAYDTSANESDYSNEVQDVINVAPSAPVLNAIIVAIIQDGELLSYQILSSVK